MISVKAAAGGGTGANATGKYEQALFFFEEPEIIVIDVKKVSKVVAVATKNVGGRGFFGAKVSNAQFRNYLKERFDLRYMLLRPDRWTWYEFDLPDKLTDRVKLDYVELSRHRIDEYIPEQGFFSREHTEQYRGYTSDARDVQRFEVDGQWSMGDFGRLHSQIADLYALTKSVDAFADNATPLEQKQDIVKSFVKPFQGGGSYVALFRSLAKAGGDEAKPDIKAIQWASPGFMDVVGDADAFDRMISLVEHFSGHRGEIKDAYEHLWSYLKETQFLNRTSRTLDYSSSISTEIATRATELARLIGVTSYSLLIKMAGQDHLVAAKALLGSARRIAKLHEFFAEGRVSVAGTTID